MDNLVQIKSKSSGHCLFRIPEETGRVLWQLTNVCNYNCRYCIFSSGPERIEGELSFEEICRILAELKQANFRSIKFTGGEPFARKDLISILERAHQLNLQFDLSTNASLIDKRRAIALAKTDPEMVHVSLDGGDEETHDSIRGGGTFKKTLAGILNLTHAGMKLRIGCVVFRNNETKLDSIVGLCHTLGANEVIFSRMQPLGELRGNNALCATRSDASLNIEVEALASTWRNKIKVSGNFQVAASYERPARCPGGERFLFIDNLGFLSPCTWALEHDPKVRTFRSLKETSLNELLGNSVMNDFRAMIAEREANGAVGCPYA